MSLSSQPILTGAVLRFHAFELHPARGLLLCDGNRVKLQPQPLRVLAHLVLRAPAIVSRDELAEVVWPNVHVDLDTSLNFCIRQIRAALNDNAVNPRFIETLPRQGYRFIAPVTCPGDKPDSNRPDSSLTPASERLPTRIDEPHPFPAPASSQTSTSSPRRPALLAAGFLALFVPLALAVFLYTRHSRPAEAPLHAAAAPHTPAALAINPEAHEAYLRGRYLWFRGANEGAGSAFRRAIELDPTNALAWSGLADYYGQGAGESLDPRDALPRAEFAARRAVQLDPASADAHLSLGASLYFNRWDFPAAQREIDRSLELNPRLAQALHFRAKILSSLERHPEAIAAERDAAELDPFARPWAIAHRLLQARRYADAREAALQHARAEPHSLDVMESLEAISCAEGDHRACVRDRARHLELMGDHAGALRLQQTFARGGFHAVLLADLASLQHRAARQYVAPFAFASVYIQLGQHEDALRMLEESFHQHDPNLLLVGNLAIFDPLHSDPQYRALIRQIGLPAAF